MYKNRLLVSILVCVLVGGLSSPLFSRADELTDLEKQLEARQKQIESLQQKQAAYEASIAKKRSEARTLANQISIINDQLQRTTLSIETLQTKIEATEIEIGAITKQIESQEQLINEAKQELAKTVRALARTQDNSLLQIMLTHKSFSDFYEELQGYTRVQMAAVELVDEVEDAKAALADKQSRLSTSKLALDDQQDNLTDKQYQLSDEQELQQYILGQTKLDEQRFAALLNQVKQEQAEADREIKRLEREVRARLEAEGKITDAATTLQWPVPKNRVTARFRDPDYPFNHLFKHDAIDIRAAQGTTIVAPADGYVAKVRTGDPKRYWYVVLVHDGGISTVYGHVSRVYVADGQKVSAGQSLALSGGARGAPGSGPFSTGAHLHFEVHKDGTPVDPLGYLP